MNPVRSRRGPIWTLALALCAVFLVACGAEESGPHADGNGRPGRPGGGRPEEPPVPVAVSPAKVGDIASSYAATATLEAEAEAEVLARVSGVVERLHCEEGDFVRQGQAMLQVDNDEYRLRVQQAQARTANLQSRYDRLQGMSDKGLVSEEEFDTARSDLESARADEGLADLALSHTRVVSPLRGRVVNRLVDVGQNVSVGTPLFRVADFDPLLARVHVPSKEFRSLQTDQAVELRLDSDDSRLEGRIKLVSPVIDPNSGTIKVTVEIPVYPEDVRPGDFAEVLIVTARHENRTLVPRGAVVTDKGDDVVYVARDGVAERRVVEIGFTDTEHVEIISGVEPGDPVVVKGQRSLRHGAPLRILEDSLEAPVAAVDAR